MEHTKKHDVLVKNALILAIGGFAAKAIGAIYRIPLTNLLGGEGMGIYQTVFPLYCMILTLSSTGIPAGLSRLIAAKNEEDGRRLFLVAIRLMALIGLLGSVLMAVLGGLIAKAQGAPLARKSYLALAPSVLIVSLVSCYRGYAQGKLKMLPTALSQLIEQVFKLAFGLLFSTLFLPDISRAAAGAVLGVTLSELVALGYLALRFRVTEPKMKIPVLSFRSDAKQIALTVVPVVLSSLLIPLSHVIDSFMIVNLLSRHTGDATTLYGLFTGAVNSLVNLPVALAYGVAAAIIPVLSVRAARGDDGAVQKQTSLAVGLTIFIAIPFALYFIVLGGDAVDVLYGGLEEVERQTVVGLLRVSSLSVVFLSLTQTLSSALVGQGKPYVPVVTLAVGVVVKTIASAITLQMPTLGIYGAAISTNLCYLVAGLGNLVYSIKGGKTALRLMGWVIVGFTAGGIAVGVASALRLGGVQGALIRTATAGSITVLSAAIAFFLFQKKSRKRFVKKVDEL